MDLNTASDTFVAKFIINNETIYLKVIWKNNENEMFRLKVYEENRTWSGRFSTEFAEKYRECFDETKLEYLNNVKQSLSGDSNEFVHSFSRVVGEVGAATFVWKKKFEGSTATRIHGSVSLKLDETPEPKDNLIDYLLNENKCLHQAVVEINEKSNIVTEELEKCKQEMEKYVNIKTTLESVLYGKFVQILNSKKRRIELLEENLQKFHKENNA